MSGYIGTQPVPQATQTRDSFTATSGQTSFATGGFTPNFLDVFLNGIKLAAADYTATNGSDVVLASGAATGDILEVVAYTAFDTANVTGATNFTVTGAFTSQGIDDNSNATALTIDSSENVLIGTTDNTLYNNSTGTGTKIGGDGRLDVSRQADTVATFNRTGSSNGEVIRVVASGTTVGTIGSSNSGERLYMVNDSTGLSFLGDFSRILPCNISGTPRDNAIDLGQGSGGRFKDLYLSGGVHLGGTGAANKLDDYEEGTWTPSFSSGYSVSAYSVQYGTYTKIGNTVRAYFRVSMQTASTTSSQVIIAGLPFTAINQSHHYTTGTSYINTSSGNGDSVKPLVFQNSSAVYLYYQGTTGVTGLVGTNLGTQLDILGQVIYEV